MKLYNRTKNLTQAIIQLFFILEVIHFYQIKSADVQPGLDKKKCYHMKRRGHKEEKAENL